MPGVAPFSAAVVANLPWVAHSVLQASPSSAAAAEVRHVHHISRAAASRQAAFHNNPPAADGKVDVFLDLGTTEEGSMAAWATIKQVVWEYGFRTSFVFHVLPPAHSRVAFDAAKAFQVIRMYTADSSDECVLFIDAILENRAIIHSETDDDEDVVRHELFEVLAETAVAAGIITEDQFKREMEDPQLDSLVRNEIEEATSLGVSATPTVLLNGIFMMRLADSEQLRNFELFVGVGLTAQPLFTMDGEGTWESVAGIGKNGEHGSNDYRDVGLLGELDESGELPRDNVMSATM